MCGIAGLLQVDGLSATAADQLRAAAAVLKHRGPDGSEVRCLSKVGFAHTRLAVIDLQTGVQPMSSPSGRTLIAFNGEIYNYRALRAGLVKAGYPFTTNSDTEVILALYETGGVDAFRMLRGMYAFCLWDELQQTAHLVRDPCGIKPMFYTQDARGTVFFASEAKGIVAMQSTPSKLDESSLHLLLNFRYVPGERSLFGGILQLAPGAVMSWRSDGRLRLGAIGEPSSAPEGDLAQALEESVRLHLESDVEVGAYLSGGLDSAVVVACARNTSSVIPTFTLPFGDDPAEASNAAETARILQLSNLCGSAASVTGADPLVQMWHMEVPRVNGLQSHALAKLARTRVKVALSGLGGDELFYGYNVYRWMRWARTANRGLGQWGSGWVRRLAAAYAANARTPFTEQSRVLELLGSGSNWPRVYGLLRNVWDDQVTRRWLYGPRMLDADLPDADQWLQSVWPSEADPLRAVCEFEWRNKMVNDLLWNEDRSSMAVGLEVRVPFVDVRLKQLVRSAQARVSARDELGKRRLRAVAKELLPRQVLERRKSGFQIDPTRLFGGDLMDDLDCWLSPEAVRQAGLFRPEAVAKLRELPAKSGYRWHKFMLWMILQAHIWLAIFEQRSHGPWSRGVK